MHTSNLSLSPEQYPEILRSNLLLQMWCGSSPQSYGKFRKSAYPAEFAACDHTHQALVGIWEHRCVQDMISIITDINKAEEMDVLRRTKYKFTVTHSQSLGVNGFQISEFINFWKDNHTIILIPSPQGPRQHLGIQYIYMTAVICTTIRIKYS